MRKYSLFILKQNWDELKIDIFLTETAGSARGNWLSARNNPSNEVTGSDRCAASISWSATDNPNKELIWAGARREGAGGGIANIVHYRSV